MADIRQLRQNRKCKNYIGAFVATYKTGESLENFTEQGLLSLHNHIKQTLGNMPVCAHQCSRNYRDINRWCVTCTGWRIELENAMPRGIRRIWNDKKSWNWPNSSRDIAEVFILPGWNTNNINLKDLSTIYNVWNRCLQFPRHVVQVLDNLKDSRNDLVHNTVSMKITSAKKKVIFQNITNVVNHPDIQPSLPNNANLLQTLRDLKKGKLFQDDIRYTFNQIGKQNADIKAKLDRLALTLDDTNRTFHLQLEKLQKRFTRQAFVIPMVMVFAIAIMFGLSPCLIDPLCTMIQTKSSQQTGQFPGPRRNLHILTSREGCLSETSNTMPYSQISLFEYLAHHNNFVGRNWLIDHIRKELFNMNANNRGILLEAGMGYGKSALIKHIICSSSGGPAGKLRSQLVSYYVCRFDVLISKLSYVFVLRLINMISSQMPFIADGIKSCSNVFNRDMCERDPNGCLDQCLIIPLKNIPYSGSEPVIIAIDGLDECFDTYRDMNEILLILKQRLYRFPAWVKFLVSSRPDSRIRHLTTDLLFLELSDESEDNMNDINAYLKQLSIRKSTKTNDKLIDYNISNFLVLSLLHENKEIEAVGTSLSTSLDRYYDEQFTRLFKNKVSMRFEDAKIILEVMFSTFQTPTKEIIWSVVSNVTDMTLKQFDKSVQMLDSFFRKIGNELRLIHISLQQWLMSAENVDFYVDIENGHEVNAKYIFRLIENGFYQCDIVDLAIHVGISSSRVLYQRFLNLSEKVVAQLEHDAAEYPLLRLARRADSYITTDILTLHFKAVDHRNKDNQTALFITASLGHLKTFDALIKKGSNIRYRTDSFQDIINFENASKVSIEHYLWDYGVLDIAAQNGHTNIIEYVLKNNKVLFDYPMEKVNSMMLLPIHLACKKGHLKVVQQLHSRYKWMLDWQCLYYASEIGKVSLVKYILERNIKDECRQCEPYIHWIPKGQLRVQGQLLYLDSHNYTYVLYDDWGNITCESALHIAVRENKLGIVKLLVGQSEHAAECFDRGGRTPIISALQNGFKDIVEYFISTGLLRGIEKCAAVINLNDRLKLHKSEWKRLESYFCETNMSVAHIIAKYDPLWVFDMMTEYGVKLDWNSKDNMGCYPIHKAACHSSMTVLRFLLKQFDTQSEYYKWYKCINGSTPLHSAIACGSVSATEILLLKYIGYNRESKTIKISYINHSLLTDYGSELANDIADIEKNISIIISMLITEVPI
ncbi:protein TANC1-like [Mercenaria mercenaria]|uniref:protein TANC1-like n=1 Tax=Mercenaria mercenaria TaxID=6596 RepID=UPI00234F4C00|nr:protein TANC1-like [Mercenaria mercenaria]